jgi:hypothetical protein
MVKWLMGQEFFFFILLWISSFFLVLSPDRGFQKAPGLAISRGDP